MTNFLNLSCPRCRRDDGIDIQATLWIRVCEEGTDADASKDGHHDFTPRSPAMCAHCSYHGRLTDFENGETSEEQTGEPISRTAWEAMWGALDNARREMPLNEFATFCNKTKAEWRQRYPGHDFSNGRYAVYIEDVLRRGILVPAEALATLTRDDIRYDPIAFPNLAPRLGVPR